MSCYCGKVHTTLEPALRCLHTQRVKEALEPQNAQIRGQQNQRVTETRYGGTGSPKIATNKHTIPQGSDTLKGHAATRAASVKGVSARERIQRREKERTRREKRRNPGVGG